MQNLLNNFKKLKFSSIFFNLLSALFVLNIINYIRFNNIIDQSFTSFLGLFEIIAFYIFIFLLLVSLSMFIKNNNYEYILTIFLFLICSILWVSKEDNIILILILFLLFLLLYKYNPIKFSIDRLLKTKYQKIYIIIFSFIALFSIGSVLILRYKTFNCPNFDFGIFSQNFYYLKKLLIPLSTLERDRLLSHFSIHISPIFYLLLPVYYIFSTPLTLQAISAFAITIGIIPVYKICKIKNIDNKLVIIVCFLYCLYTPFITGNFYDFHENVFLVPSLLWFIYFYESNNKKWFLIMLLLVLFVKEDAFIYTFIIGIYAIFDNKKDYGILSLVISFLYFLIAYYILNTYGEGIMSSRFDNLILNNDGLIGIIKTFISNPGYFIKQVTVSDSPLAKIKYILQLFIPLGFIPLYSKKWKNYILLLPLLVNIMTTYIYSYDIFFHYSFGICVLIFYVFILNVKNINKNYINICIIGSLLVFSCYVYPSIKDNFIKYYDNKEYYENAENFLTNSIPKSASVCASTFLTPHLSNRDTIYEDFYHNNIDDIDYVVLDTRYSDYELYYNSYINNGYIELSNYEDMITILKRSK